MNAGEDGAIAVAAKPGAPATELRLDDGVLPPGIGMEPPMTVPPMEANRPPEEVRHMRGEAAQHQVEHPDLDLEIEADGRRFAGWKTVPGGVITSQWAKRAGVGGPEVAVERLERHLGANDHPRRGWHWSGPNLVGLSLRSTTNSYR